ncbi:hypothetical protein CIL05_07445 [Virgibacillus profundi]|uniref:Uncharacterized protein n=1 Tax=Virgibacillus profundi TaxID=2024555 RepID=A0A2A2IGN5_9BACI|nr:hypothetical protein [Virgibacillus profundi]PAV30295.1 hypothetical protein CIL05_07445 [Virgibacillus profundi]PXY54467.1 hypothetical protein CIT14_07530 [Virgibacillus profundi]
MTNNAENAINIIKGATVYGALNSSEIVTREDGSTTYTQKNEHGHTQVDVSFDGIEISMKKYQ